MKGIVLFLALWLIFLVPLASADLSVELNVKDSFGIGETINFNYSISSDINQEITFMPRIICPNAPAAFLQQKIVSLEATKLYTDSYIDITVDESIKSQTCTAYVQILSPIQKIVSKNFSITTTPSFDFSIKLDKKVFVRGENVYLDYSSSIENPSISAILTYPDNTTKQLTLPTSIKAEQIGTYELNVGASKEGYNTATQKEQFGVIEGNAVISETNQSIGEIKQNYGFFVIVLLILILIAWVVMKYFRAKKVQNNNISIN